MHVAALDASHADAAVALWRDCDLTRPWNDPYADYARALSGPSSAVLGAFLPDADGDLVGTVMVGGDGHRGWVYYLAADPARRRQGIGRRLMEAAEAWLTERGLPKIQFLVRGSNGAVLDFYDHLGYETQDVVVLGRRLDG